MKRANNIVPRDYSNELRNYLAEWKNRDVYDNDMVTWKFNKLLQSWALENCFDKKRVDSITFKALLPYIMTIQGAALNRLKVKPCQHNCFLLLSVSLIFIT